MRIRWLERQLAGQRPGAVLGTLGLVLLCIMLFVPVPFVILGPGPTQDTLGVDDVGHEELITITGRETYPTEGQLRLTTVGVEGKPGRLPSMLHLGGGGVLGLLERSRSVQPFETVYPPGETAEQVEDENRADMLESQHNATSAAMRQLNIAPISVVVDQVLTGNPADGKLRVGDVLLDIDGEPITTSRQVREIVTKRRPGDVLPIKVRRTPEGGKPEDITVQVTAGSTTDAQPRTVIGVVPGERYPFTVDIRLEDIGGPSAGTMFALGIVDKLTPGSLTGGKVIAGTGTIDVDGNVGPIGGIGQKLAGAKDAGATVFLAPALNCAEALQYVPHGLRVVKISTLDGAIRALDALRTGQGDVPSC